MKKLVLALSFVFVMGLVAVNAQTPVTKAVKKAPAKTEQTAKPAVAATAKPAVKPTEAAAPAAKPAVRAKKAKKVAEPVKK